MLQLRNKNLAVAVVGSSGSGKSTFAVCYLLNGKFTCRFIFDPRHEFEERFQRRACKTAAELRASVATGWVIFDPSFLYPGDPTTALEMFLEWAWTISEKLPGQKIAYVDEVWKYSSTAFIPKHLGMIAMDGRKNGIGCLLTTHRPNKLNDAIVGELTELVGFWTKGHLKIEWLEKNFDEFPVSDLPNLKRFQYIAQNLESGGIARGMTKI